MSWSKRQLQIREKRLETMLWQKASRSLKAKRNLSTALEQSWIWKRRRRRRSRANTTLTPCWGRLPAIPTQCPRQLSHRSRSMMMRRWIFSPLRNYQPPHLQQYCLNKSIHSGQEMTIVQPSPVSNHRYDHHSYLQLWYQSKLLSHRQAGILEFRNQKLPSVQQESPFLVRKISLTTLSRPVKSHLRKITSMPSRQGIRRRRRRNASPFQLFVCESWLLRNVNWGKTIVSLFEGLSKVSPQPDRL